MLFGVWMHTIKLLLNIKTGNRIWLKESCFQDFLQTKKTTLMRKSTPDQLQERKTAAELWWTFSSEVLYDLKHVIPQLTVQLVGIHHMVYFCQNKWASALRLSLFRTQNIVRPIPFTHNAPPCHWWSFQEHWTRIKCCHSFTDLVIKWCYMLKCVSEGSLVITSNVLGIHLVHGKCAHAKITESHLLCPLKFSENPLHLSFYSTAVTPQGNSRVASQSTLSLLGLLLLLKKLPSVSLAAS